MTPSPNEKGPCPGRTPGQGPFPELADRRVGLYAGFCAPGPRGRRGDGHPSRTGVATGLLRSTRGLGRAALEHPRRDTEVSPLDLAPSGVYLAA
ncbi:hypothetical protein BN2537_12361 [Streptomyces venezuelae]|nr:hypothetical protein BN2537_12361 [Streptomyces venezuelae]